MPHDPEAFAEMVTLTIKAALTPVLERVAGLDARLTQVQGLESSLAALRDRVVAVETKAVPLQVETAPDLTSVFAERLGAVDARVARVAGLELTVGEIRDRLLTVETKAAMPHETEGPSLTDVELSVRAALDPLMKSLSALQERIAIVEVRAQVPGPPGKDGKDGLDGKDGAPGLDGAPGKDGLAGLSFEGVYQEGKSYDVGNLVTWGGSSWHCNEPTTTKPGDGSKAWTLMVKRGRDGKDGRDAQTLPVVTVAR